LELAVLWTVAAVENFPVVCALVAFCFVVAGAFAILDRYLALFAVLEMVRLNRQTEIECVRLAPGRTTKITIDRKTSDTQSLTVPDSSTALKRLARHRMIGLTRTKRIESRNAKRMAAPKTSSLD
jgi:hypothetical protein